MRRSFSLSHLSHWQRWLNRLVDPPASIAQTEAAPRARMMSGLLLFTFFLIVVYIITQPFLGSPPDQVRFMLGALGLIFGGYVVSRTRWHAVVPIWFVIALFVSIYAICYLEAAEGDNSPAFFMTLPIFVTALFFSTWHVAAVTALTMGAIALLPTLTQQPAYDVPNPFMFVWTMGVLVASTAYLRQRDYERVQVSEARYRNLMEVTTQAIVMFDKKGNVLDINPAFTHLLGYTLADLRDRSVLRVVAAHQRQHLYTSWLERAENMHQIEGKHKLGHRVDLETTMTTHVFQGELAFVAAARDIGPQREIERQRIENELRYQALFNNTADAVMMIGLDGRIIIANDQTFTMLRAQEADVIGAHYHTYVAPGDIAQADTIIHRVLAGESLPLYERHFQRSDGTQFIGEVNAMLVKDGEGKALYMQAIVRDTTTRRQVEEHKFELALQRARMSILQKFIDDASHYFRTPLTNLKTANYLLGRFGHAPDKQQEQMEVIELQVKRLEQLLNDLLTVAQLDRDSSQPTRTARIHINRLLSEILPRQPEDPAAPRLEHQWVFEPNEDELIVMGDYVRLAHAIRNILANARQYTPAGGMIRVRTYQHQALVMIEVLDTGIGIEPADLPHIFDNFYRTDAAGAIQSISNGMGLAISQRIIQMHRGIIRVSSVPGRGSTFQVVLPPAGDWTNITQQIDAPTPQPVQNS